MSEQTPEYHRQPEWQNGLDYEPYIQGVVKVRVTFVALVHPDWSGNLDFGGVGDLQGTIGSRLESGKMEALGFRSVIVEKVDPHDAVIPCPMFTPEGGI